ncbi:PREDICTED: 2-oxo-4-hydroxy-4-carboxy-5-ureidoimidazoline decarboxylase-like, partial [Priapulus caudatus]|uniref:2-oxo-4-hydroxy-4-carboxy-5-ureidoimidazoline decarboxylase n=1 Tax=Priapulus caudatus TaxID=37621 RepID=A0ABM1EY99_PRICU
SDIVGSLAEAGEMTEEHIHEQQSAGLLTLTSTERQRRRTANDAYTHKFDFPFVVCARENKKDVIMTEIERRLLNESEQELSTGINEVKKICYYRILNIAVQDVIAVGYKSYESHFGLHSVGHA